MKQKKLPSLKRGPRRVTRRSSKKKVGLDRKEFEEIKARIVQVEEKY